MVNIFASKEFKVSRDTIQIGTCEIENGISTDDKVEMRARKKFKINYHIYLKI